MVTRKGRTQSDTHYDENYSQGVRLVKPTVERGMCGECQDWYCRVTVRQYKFTVLALISDRIFRYRYICTCIGYHSLQKPPDHWSGDYWTTSTLCRYHSIKRTFTRTLNHGVTPSNRQWSSVCVCRSDNASEEGIKGRARETGKKR